MGALRANQDMLNLMYSMKPFIGDFGKTMIDAGEAFAQLLATENAAKAMEGLQKVKSSQPALNPAIGDIANKLKDMFGQKAQSPDLTETAEIVNATRQSPVWGGSGLVFAVFIILILLFFSN